MVYDKGNRSAHCWVTGSSAGCSKPESRSSFRSSVSSQQLLATPGTANFDVLRGLILRSASFGVGGAVPLSAVGDSPADRQTLLAQAASVQKELAERVEQLTGARHRF
jgi:hypothetical protein